MYNLNRSRLIRRVLPVKLRRTRMIAWISVLTSYLDKIAEYFTAFREVIYYEYKFNGLIHSLEWLLNDRYDPILRRIEIVPVDNIAVMYFKSSSEIPETYWKSSYQLQGYFFHSNETHNAAQEVDYEFKIRVNAAIEFNHAEMLQLVDTYRFAGLRPKVFLYITEEGDFPVE